MLREVGLTQGERTEPGISPSEPLLTTVVLSGQSGLPWADKDRRRLKRASFVAVASLANGGAAFTSLLLAHFIVDRGGLGGGYSWLAGISAASGAVLTLASRPDTQRSSRGLLEEWVLAGREIAVTTLLLVVVAFFWRPQPIDHFSFSRGTLLLLLPVGLVLIGAARSVTHSVLLWLRKHGHNLASVIVIGDGASADSFMRTLAAKQGTGYRVVAHVTGAEGDRDIASIVHNLAVTMPVDEVVVASFDLPTDQIQAMISEPSLREVKIRTVPELFGLPPSKVQVLQFADFPLLTLYSNPIRGVHWRVKRTLDLAVSAIALVLLSPILGLIALVIRRDSPGPILFRQERVGMDGKRFNVLKFRTMTANSSDDAHRQYMTMMLAARGPEPTEQGTLFKLTDDPRVTRVGKVLRRFSLDELPQLINVLRGEMSLVGPRPALEYEVALYEDWQRRRLDVPPGMTGLWQVSGRSRLSPADMMRLDVHYAETWSLSMDFRIILRTVAAVARNDAR